MTQAQHTPGPWVAIAEPAAGVPLDQARKLDAVLQIRAAIAAATGGAPASGQASPAPAVYGVAAAPFTLFQSDDGQSVLIERHDGPSPVRWTIEPQRLVAAIEAMLEGEG